MNNKVTLDQIIEKYNDLLKEANKFNFLVRDSLLQSEQISNLSKFLVQIRNFKLQAIELENESRANLFFQFQCVINSVISSLKMNLSLKEGNYELAWSHLVMAQEYLVYSRKVDFEGFGIIEFQERLSQIENLLFPGFPYFNSPGFLLSGGVCSICQGDLNTCEHLEEKVYWGKVCKRINVENVSLDHASLVIHPKDRRCIITQFETDDGFLRNIITWKIEGKVGDKTENDGRQLSVILFNNQEYDIF